MRGTEHCREVSLANGLQNPKFWVRDRYKICRGPAEEAEMIGKHLLHSSLSILLHLPSWGDVKNLRR